MTAIQLNAALHRELSHILTDDTMMERALKSLRKIRRERKAELMQQDATRQVAAGLRQAFNELKQVQEGKLEAKSIKELFDELRD